MHHVFSLRPGDAVRSCGVQDRVLMFLWVQHVSQQNGRGGDLHGSEDKRAGLYGFKASGQERRSKI